MKITREMIMEARTPRGAWNKPQLEAIGVTWPPTGGWITWVGNREYTEEQVDRFRELSTAKHKERTPPAADANGEPAPLEEIIRPDEFLPRIPAQIKRPCDYGLKMAMDALETQLGTIEAFNRLCAACEKMRAQIDEGNAKEQHPFFRTDIGNA